MSNEDAFIRALRERPDDETTRLVYADWLDDRSDPRAAYLRAEAAWVALQPSDEQYRPLYRRVSQLAAGLEPEWFETVSRVTNLARSEWARATHFWEPYQYAPAIAPNNDLAIDDIRRTFATCIGELSTARRFHVPVDYLAFISMSETCGGWWRNSDRRELYSAGRACQETLYRAAVFSGDELSDLEMCLSVAILGDHRHFLLGCDLECSRFGTVAEVEDYHPGMVAGSAPVPIRGDTFLQFLVNWSVDE